MNRIPKMRKFKFENAHIWKRIFPSDNFVPDIISCKKKIYPAITASKSNATIFVILIIGFTAGPAVSL